LEKPIVTKFKEAIMKGDWDLVLSLGNEIQHKIIDLF
jgi:hypothetical protein